MPAYGVTPAGFVAKPFAQILADIQAAQLGTMNPAIDLSPTGPQGQQNGIIANMFADLWQLLGVVANSFNRQSVEGAGLDNLGDLIGVPREGGSYTKVSCTLTFTGGVVGNTFAAGTLVANVSGNPALSLANQVPLTVSSTTMTAVTMQATTIGATPSINAGTLTQITNPVTGWTSITNPAAQTQLGANAELDPAYAVRQEEELGANGSSTLPSTVAALLAVAAAQAPPIALTVSAFENTTRANVTYGSLTLIPNSYAIVAYDSGGWVSSTPGQDAIGAAIWANKPAGTAPVGTTSVVIADPFLGSQTVYYTVPTPAPLYFQITLAIRPGAVFASVTAAIQTALVSAAIAPTPVGGSPPNGQLAPGGAVIGSQLEAVIMGVPGVLDVQVLEFGTSYLSTNTAPLIMSPTQIAQIKTGTDGSSHPFFTFTQGSAP